MENSLKIILGSNYFSLSELGNLKKGDIVVTSKHAGEPQELVWNNIPVALGEIVVIEDLLGFRMTSFEIYFEKISAMHVKEKLIDIVSASIILSEKSITTDELYQIKEHSVITFGDKMNDLKALLYFGDKVIAKGIVCVIREYLGIEITEVNFPIDFKIIDYPYKSTGNVIKNERKTNDIKHYDFCKPDKFSLLFLNNLMRVHERFIENVIFNNKSETDNISAKIKFIDQLAFFETFDEMKTLMIQIVKMNRGTFKKPIENNIELQSSPHKISDDTRKWFDKMINSINDFDLNILLLYHETNPFIEKEIFENSFKKAWETVTHVEPEMKELNVDFEAASMIIPKNDMICIIDFEYEYGRVKNNFKIVYPYMTIEYVIPKLSGILL